MSAISEPLRGDVRRARLSRAGPGLIVQAMSARESIARLTDAELDGWRKRCDPPADAVVAAFEERGERTRDLLGACRRLAPVEPRCAAFLDAVRARPPFTGDVEAALRLFERNGPLVLLLGFPVLIESYAGARDNKVLVLSGRLAGSGAFARLVETARFVAAVCAPGALAPEEAGWRSALSVRLLHAWVRSLSRRAGYDVARYDEPINQEALAGTLTLFGHGILACLTRLGVSVKKEEAESWHALWRHVGWLIGVDPALLPETYEGEVALYERIKAHEFRPDADTRVLFEAALEDVTRGSAERMPMWFKALGGWTLASRTFLEQLTLRCVDPALARALGLRPEPIYRAMFDGAALSQRAVGGAQHLAPIERASRAFMGTLARELPPVLAGTRVTPRYDDPGFRQLRARASSARRTG